MSPIWIKMTKLVPEMPRVDSIGMYWMVSLRQDVTASWMLPRTEYRLGTAGVPVADNSGRGLLHQYWNLDGLQLAYRF